MGALGLVAVWSPAYAQQAPLQDLITTRQLDAELSVTELADSNVARSDARLAAARGLKESDLVTSPVLSVNAALPLGRKALFFTGAAGYDFYERNHVLSRERVDLSGGGEAHLASCFTRLTGGYDLRQSDLAETINVNAVTVRGVRNLQDKETAALEVACGRSSGLQPSLTVSDTAVHNSADQLKPLDNRMLNVAPALVYARPAFGAIQLFGQFADVTYDHSYQLPELVSINPPVLRFVTVRNGFRSTGGGARYDRNIGSRLQGGVFVSYTNLEPAQALSHGFSGVTYGADVTYAPTGRLALHVKADRGPQPSNQYGSAYYVDNNYGIDVKYSLGTRMTIDLGVAQDQRDYDVPNNITLALIHHQRVRSAFVDTRYNIGRRFYVALNAALESRRATLVDYNYTSARAAFTVGVKY